MCIRDSGLPERWRVRAPPAPAQCRFPDLTASTLGGSRSARASGAGAIQLADDRPQPCGPGPLPSGARVHPRGGLPDV
eukprot:9855147-Alexandrium_andersonii.AAC.1